MSSSARIVRHLPLLLLLLIAAACQSPSWPAPDADSPAVGADPGHLAAAEAAYLDLLQAPEDVQRIIWYGRRLGYLGRYEDAIAVFSRGLLQHPDSAELLRHRGHRWVSLRRFADAETDLGRAARLIEGAEDRVEADGLPNARGQPTSSLHTNVWYHLGLARYCQGDFGGAVEAFGACVAASWNPDMEAAARYWLYLSATRAGDAALAAATLAAVDPAWDIIENHAYHQLLLLYRGDLEALPAAAGASATSEAVQDATRAYGLANDRLRRGDRDGARVMREPLAAAGGAAFGCIAAEADLARWRG